MKNLITALGLVLISTSSFAANLNCISDKPNKSGHAKITYEDGSTGFVDPIRTLSIDLATNVMTINGLETPLTVVKNKNAPQYFMLAEASDLILHAQTNIDGYVLNVDVGYKKGESSIAYNVGGDRSQGSKGYLGGGSTGSFMSCN